MNSGGVWNPHCKISAGNPETHFGDLVIKRDLYIVYRLVKVSLFAVPAPAVHTAAFPKTLDKEEIAASEVV